MYVCGNFFSEQPQFGQNRFGHFDSTNILMFCAFGLKTSIYALSGLFWSKNRGNWKPAFLPIYQCNNPELTSYSANRLKIGSKV